MDTLRKYTIFSNTLRAISKLDWGLLYFVSDVLCFFLHRIIRYRRKIVRQNLVSSFPEKSITEIKEIEKGFYHQLCDTIVETVKLLTISKCELGERVEVKGAANINSGCNDQHPAILYTAHYGNWEWIPSIQFFYSKDIISGEIYKPLRDKAMDKILCEIRAKMGSILIKQKSAMRRIIEMKNRSQRFLIGFVADHRLNSPYTSFHADFLNHQSTPFATGPERIGNHVDARFYYLHVAKSKRGHYVFTIIPMTPRTKNSEFPFTDEYCHLLEENIKENPSLWLWSHRRWLYH